MARELKKFDLGNGEVVEETVCMNYKCRYCGARAYAGNFVADMCLQVIAKHQGLCGAYVESDKYTGYVSKCTTCSYYSEDGKCLHD